MTAMLNKPSHDVRHHEMRENFSVVLIEVRREHWEQLAVLETECAHQCDRGGGHKAVNTCRASADDQTLTRQP